MWSATLKCLTHSHEIEIDGFGLPPPDLRASILKDEGVYELVFNEDSNRVGTLRKIQIILSLSIKNMEQIRSRLPGAMFFGTRHEMEWLAASLTSQGVPAAVQTRDTARVPGSLDLADVAPSLGRNE
jgi:hypothetical protein